MLSSPSWLFSVEKSQALPGIQGRSPRTCEQSWQRVHLFTLEASGVKLRVDRKREDCSFDNIYAEQELGSVEAVNI